MIRESRFTYSRPVTDDVATALAAARDNAWCDAQLVILDVAIAAICVDLAEYYEGFNEERFKTRAHYWANRSDSTIT